MVHFPCSEYQGEQPPQPQGVGIEKASKAQNRLQLGPNGPITMLPSKLINHILAPQRGLTFQDREAFAVAWNRAKVVTDGKFYNDRNGFYHQLAIDLGCQPSDLPKDHLLTREEFNAYVTNTRIKAELKDLWTERSPMTKKGKKILLLESMLSPEQIDELVLEDEWLSTTREVLKQMQEGSLEQVSGFRNDPELLLLIWGHEFDRPRVLLMANGRTPAEYCFSLLDTVDSKDGVQSILSTVEAPQREGAEAEVETIMAGKKINAILAFRSLAPIEWEQVATTGPFKGMSLNEAFVNKIHAALEKGNFAQAKIYFEIFMQGDESADKGQKKDLLKKILGSEKFQEVQPTYSRLFLELVDERQS